jgi:hypothetical protein
MTKVRNTISAKYIREYLTETYGRVKQDPIKFSKALRSVGNEYKVNKKDLFHLIIENRGSIPMSTSYGFQTRYGRELINEFKNKYYNL